MDIYALRFEIVKLREQLEQKNYEINEFQTELFEKREQLREYKGLSDDKYDLQNELKSLSLQKQQAEEYANKINEENYKIRRRLKEIRRNCKERTCYKCNI